MRLCLALVAVQLMSKTRVPCALVTTMDRHTTGELLEKLGLRNYFTCLVTGAPLCMLGCRLGISWIASKLHASLSAC